MIADAETAGADTPGHPALLRGEKKPQS